MDFQKQGAVLQTMAGWDLLDIGMFYALLNLRWGFASCPQPNIATRVIYTERNSRLLGHLQFDCIRDIQTCPAIDCRHQAKSACFLEAREVSRGLD